MQFEVDAANNYHYQQSLNSAAAKESHQHVNKIGLVGYHFTVVVAKTMLNNARHALLDAFAKMVLHCFGGSERNHAGAVVAYVGHCSARVDHRLGNERIAKPLAARHAVGTQSSHLAMRLRRAAHHRAHIRLILVGHCLAVLPNHRGGTDVCPLAHVYTVASNGNKSACRCGIIVDERHHRALKVQYGGAHAVGMFHRASVGVQMQQHGIYIGIICHRQSLAQIAPRRAANLCFDVYHSHLLVLGNGNQHRHAHHCNC